MARTKGSGWGGGTMLYQICPFCGKKKALHIADVSKSACLCNFSDRYWDKNGSKCLKCGKHFS
jgi:hypothetical protein